MNSVRMTRGIQHMILEEDDLKNKRSGRTVLLILIPIFAFVVSLIAVAVAVKALSEVTDLRNEVALLRTIKIQSRNIGVPKAQANLAALANDNTAYMSPESNDGDLIQNITKMLRKEMRNMSTSNKEYIMKVEAKHSSFEVEANKQIKALNRSTEFADVHVARIERKQTRLEDNLTNLTLVFNERNKFHEIRGEGSVNDLLLLEDKVNTVLAEFLGLETKVENNTNTIRHMRSKQQRSDQNLAFLSNALMNDTILYSQHFNFIGAEITKLTRLTEEQAENFTTAYLEMAAKNTNRFLHLQRLIQRVLNASNAISSEDFENHQRHTLSHRTYLEQLVNQLRAKLRGLEVQSRNITKRVGYLESAAHHMSWHTRYIYQTLRLHSARLNATEQHLSSNSSTDDNSTAGEAIAEVILENQARSQKNEKQVNRLEKDFCESIGLVYGDQCIRMAYARGPDVNHTTAAEICEAQGGHLADIENNDMVKLVVDLVNATYRGNAASVELWIGNVYHNGNVLLSTGERSTVSKWLHSAPAPARGNFMALYIGLDPGIPSGVFNAPNNVPHLTPLCSFEF